MDTQSVSGSKEGEIDCVTGSGKTSLTFTAVDGIAFAARKKRLRLPPRGYFCVGDLGPLLELLHLSADGLFSNFEDCLDSSPPPISELLDALGRKRYWICSSTKRMGFLRTKNNEDDQLSFYRLSMAAQQAASDVGFSKLVAGQLAAAIGEMVDNIYVHSKRSESGLVAFKARPGYFEFAVLDRGIGMLRSLQQSADYVQLMDHGDALQTALTDGCSRFGSDTNHGHGFRSLFIGLSNLNGALRFRSGDHALIIDGRNPISIPWSKVAKPHISGFSAFISCRTQPTVPA